MADNLLVEHLHAVVLELTRRGFRDPVGNFEYASELVEEGLVRSDNNIKKQVAAPLSVDPDPHLETVEKLLLFRMVGVTLSDGAIARIGATVSRLKRDKDLSEVEFWGKVLTNGKKDYFICQSKQGDKMHTFYTVGWDGEWRCLECVDPLVLFNAVQYSYVFTGTPDAVVESVAARFGTEEEYLSAIVSRINACTSIGPVSHGKKRIIPTIHCHQHVGLGSFCHIDGSRDETAPQVHEVPSDVTAWHNRGLDRDPKGSWTVRYFGDPNMYLDEKDDHMDLSLGRVRISSEVWPGYHYVLSGYLGTTASIYIGNGIRRDL